MNFDEILRIVEGSSLSEAAKGAVRVVIDRGREKGELSDEEKEQILAIFELEEKEAEYDERAYEDEGNALEAHLRELDTAVEEALHALEKASEELSKKKKDPEV